MEEKHYAVGAVGLGGESVFLSVDHFHRPGETLRAGSIFTEPGGKAYNQAVAAQRLGGTACFFGAVGNDEAAQRCRKFLQQEGVEPILQTVEEAGTAYACILTDSRGENQVTVFRGAAESLTPGFIVSHEAEIARCDCLLLTLECPIETVKAAAETAKRNGVFTILNPAPAIPLPQDLISLFDVITPNRQEAAQILQLDGEPETDELARAICKAGFERVIVTLGGDGALLVEKGMAYHFPAMKVPVVDTTGAGDTFNAAVAVALSKGRSLLKAVEYAVVASSCSVRKQHVMDSLPTRETVERYFGE